MQTSLTEVHTTDGKNQEVFTLEGAAAEAAALHTTASFAQLRYLGAIWNATSVPWESQHQTYAPVITNNDQHHLVFDVLPPLQHQQQQFLPTAKVESNFRQTCKKNLAQLRLCNPSSCSKWTRSLPVVGGRYYITFIPVLQRRLLWYYVVGRAVSKHHLLRAFFV